MSRLLPAGGPDRLGGTPLGGTSLGGTSLGGTSLGGTSLASRNDDYNVALVMPHYSRPKK